MPSDADSARSEHKKSMFKPFENERELQKWVQEHHSDFLSKDGIWIPRELAMFPSDTDKIWRRPDGFILDLNSDRWYVVETELRKHRFWRMRRDDSSAVGHIAEQLLVFTVAARNKRTLDALGEHIFEYVRLHETERLPARYYNGNGGDSRLKRRIQCVLSEHEPTIVVFVDNCRFGDKFLAEFAMLLRALKLTTLVFGVEKNQLGQICGSNYNKPLVQMGAHAASPVYGLDLKWLHQVMGKVGVDICPCLDEGAPFWQENGRPDKWFFLQSDPETLGSFYGFSIQSRVMRVLSIDSQESHMVLLCGEEAWAEFTWTELHRLLSNVGALDQPDSRPVVFFIDLAGKVIYGSRWRNGRDIDQSIGCWS
jgi:hypothetical protein